MNINWVYGLQDVQKLMADTPFNWYVAGGWAIDSYLGKVTRSHADVDIAVMRQDKSAIFDYLEKFDLQIVVGSEELLSESSAAQLTSARHAVWVKERETGNYLFELLFNESKNNEWIYRRNNLVSLPLDMLGILKEDLAILAPEIVLLYKSKNPREVDEVDFKLTLPRLSDSSRLWLKRSLQVTNPKHKWLKFRLTD
jgi:hypothetical protein